MVDRADRWHSSTEILGKDATAICDAIATCWLTIFGPFKTLVIDGERALVTEECKAFLASKGITIRTRAPNQHAQIIERRGAILRHSMHCIEEQLVREGITITFKQLLAEATFGGNCLITHNGASAFNARMGYQPAMLPDLTALPDDTQAGPVRYNHRIREVSLQKIVESTALERINRALRSHTTTPGEVADYKLSLIHISEPTRPY